MVDLGYVLRRAWEILRRHRVLWVFGFLTSLGSMGVRWGAGGRSAWQQAVRSAAPELYPRMMGGLGGPYRGILLAGLIVAGLAVSLGLAVLNAAGRVALVDQVRAAEERGQTKLALGWRAARRHLWSVFLVRVIFGLPVVLVTLVGALPVLIWWLVARAGACPLGIDLADLLILPLVLLSCLGPSICLAFVLSVPLSVLLRLAVRACVLQEYDWRRSIAHAWMMLRQYGRYLVVLWIIQFGVTFTAFVVLGLPFAVIAFGFLTALALAGLVSALLSVVLTAAAGLVIWLGAAALGGLVETYLSAMWTLAYRELLGLGLTGAEGMAV